MGMTLRELFRLTEHIEIRLAAGEKGMDNEVRWTHMVDSDTVSAFLQGQELVFTTGLGLNADLSLLQLVRDVYKNGASGIVINTGPYIKEVGQEVLDFADEHGFPVFEAPWKVHMAEIMRIFCFAIIREEQSQIELAAAFGNAFLCPEREELYLSVLMQKGYLPDWRYDVSVVRIEAEGKTITRERVASLESRLNSHLRCNYSGILCCAQETQLTVTAADCEEKALVSALEQIFTFLCAQLVHETIYWCKGKQVHGLRNLYQSYRQADKMVSMLASFSVPGERKRKAGKLLFYEDMGMYRVLITIRDEEAIREYVADTVLPLYEYDSLKQGDLAEVLQCYFRHDCSVRETAEELIVHRNTVNYKIKKAEEILGRDLSGFEVRFQLNLGFMLYHMCCSTKNIGASSIESEKKNV